jgi:hypothetical protein
MDVSDLPLKLTDNLTKENMNQAKKKRDMILLENKMNLIEKQKKKSIQFNERKAFEFTQNHKWKRKLWLRADQTFRNDFDKQLGNVLKKRNDNFALYRDNTSTLMSISQQHSNELKNELLFKLSANPDKSNPDLTHSIYQIRHGELLSNSSGDFGEKRSNLINAEIKTRVKTAQIRENYDNKFYSLTRRFIHETAPFHVETKKERNELESLKVFREKSMVKENKTITKKDTRFYNLIDTLETVKLN